jgi:hypothetical protein
VLGYTEIDSIWFYDPYFAPKIHLLNADNSTRRVKFIAETDGKAHIYLVHQVSQPEIIKNIEYNVAGDEGVGPNDVELESDNDGSCNTLFPDDKY